VTGKQFYVRTLITVGLPLILVGAFTVELFRGIKSAFRFAWLDVQINFDSYKEQMRREDY
jgi:hypothetical protein